MGKRPCAWIQMNAETLEIVLPTCRNRGLVSFLDSKAAIAPQSLTFPIRNTIILKGKCHRRFALRSTVKMILIPSPLFYPRHLFLIWSHSYIPSREPIRSVHCDPRTRCECHPHEGAVRTMCLWITSELERNPNRSVSETLGCSFHTHHDCEANQFFHLGHFMIQSLQVDISSGLRTPNHLCEWDDGGWDVCEVLRLLTHKTPVAVSTFTQAPF